MVKTHTVPYTLQQLEDLQHELTPRMLELNIQSLYVNTQENRLEIHVHQADVDIAARIRRYVKDNGMYRIVWDENPIVDLTGNLADINTNRQAYPFRMVQALFGGR